HRYRSALVPYTTLFRSPLRSTYMYGLYVYENAFKHHELGYASANAWMMFIIILLLTLMILRSSTIWVYYEESTKPKKKRKKATRSEEHTSELQSRFDLV